MILVMQDFDFCPNLNKFNPNFIQFIQIYTNLLKSIQILTKFTQVLPKFAQIMLKFFPNLPKKFAKGCCRISCIHPSFYATGLTAGCPVFDDNFLRVVAVVTTNTT